MTPLKDGDRVVFYGDSITEQRLYTRYLQQYVGIRYPDRTVRFFNAGWGGDTAPGALKRLERDVLSLQPTVVTLFFGMNDGRYRPFEQKTADDYRAGLDGILKMLKERDIRAIIYTPGAVDYDAPIDRNGRKDLRDADYNGTLRKLGDVCRGLGKQYGFEVVDVQAPMIAFQGERKKSNPKFTVIPDSIHPDAAGHLAMARAMMPALAEPMQATITLDANVPTADGAKLDRNGDAWRSTVELPTQFWVESGSTEVARLAGVDDYVRPKLVFKNLPAGKYEVGSEGGATRIATAEELAAGVPLVVSTASGKQVHDLIDRKENLYFFRWRDLLLPLGGESKLDDAVDALDDADLALTKAIHAAANVKQPVTITVQPAPSATNHALKKPYEASDPNGYNWGIGGLTDGSWEATPQHCFATGDKNVFPKTATVDLQAPVQLNAVVIGVPDFGSTKTVLVSVSEDGQTFTTVGQREFKLRRAGRQTISFSPTTARYVRLTYPDHHAESVGYSPTFAFTTEVEAYGPGGE